MNVWVLSWMKLRTLSANHEAREHNRGSLGDNSEFSEVQVEAWWRETRRAVEIADMGGMMEGVCSLSSWFTSYKVVDGTIRQLFLKQQKRTSKLEAN